MSDDKNLETNLPSEPTEEEKQQEAEALKEAKDDEIRSQVISDYELDEDVDAELIDKIVGNTLEHKKALSTAIRQKIDWRAKVHQEPPKKEEIKESQEGKKEDKEEKKLSSGGLESLLDERDRKRDLEALDVSDELKQEIKSFAEIKKVSVKEALKSDFIQFLKEKEDKKRKEEEASSGGVSGSHAVEDLSKITDPRKTFDLSTKEGRKKYEEWKKANKMV